MKWIEIISVRLSRISYASRVQEIFRNIPGTRTKTGIPLETALYVDTRTETDWSIHILRDTAKVSAQKSALGLMLAESFRALGLVHHSVWKGQHYGPVQKAQGIR